MPLYRRFFIVNLLRYLAEKIRPLSTTNFSAITTPQELCPDLISALKPAWPSTCSVLLKPVKNSDTVPAATPIRIVSHTNEPGPSRLRPF
jgi:hypothetical protein